jgi:hypothetical protein
MNWIADSGRDNTGIQTAFYFIAISQSVTVAIEAATIMSPLAAQ